MIKQIYLDYNGVISNDFALVYECVSRIFEEYGLKKQSLKGFQDKFELPVDKFYCKYLPEIDIEEIDKLYFSIYKSLSDPESYPDIIKTLRIIINYGNKSNPRPYGRGF